MTMIDLARGAIVESLGSFSVFIGLGVTTLVLFGTTLFLSNNKSTKSNLIGSAHGGQSTVDKVDELDKEKYPGGHLAIYFGSQTGTAQIFAKQIATEAGSHGFCARILDLQDVVDNEDSASIDAMKQSSGDLDNDGALIRATLTHPKYQDEDSKRSKAIFFMATYGEGEPTDNAQQFVEVMKGKSGIDNIYMIESSSEALGAARNETLLKDVDYAVFGLGNKQYEHYNNMSRFMDAALGKCGATRVADLGLGDDDDDLEGDFENWKDNVFWPMLTAKYMKDAKLAKPENMTALPSCPYVVEYVKNGNEPMSLDLIQNSARHYAQAVDCPVTMKRELRDPSDPGSTLHMEIDVSKHMDTNKYVTADNLGILSKNEGHTVQSVAEALGYDLNRYFNLLPNPDHEKSCKHSLPFPTPCTIRDCLERYCDLTGPPRRSDLKQLSSYARTEIDRKALLRMSSKEGKAEYKEKIVEAHISIADIVTRLCPSIVCPLEHFIMVCPRLQPRYYTISSSSSAHPTTIHITLAVLEEEKKDGSKFTGVCSGYLAGTKSGDMVRAFVRESTFPPTQES